jgi:predicted negative regulator of RcsB-dependent stress response
MASPSSRIASTEPRSLEETTDSVAIWFREHSRAVSIAALAVAAAAAGTFFWRTSAASKATRAEQAFFQAQAPVAQNDLATAEKELARVGQQFDGTAGGAQAQMLLAQVYYEQGKYQQGVDALKNASDAPEALRSSVKVLMAGGLEGLGKPADAAKLYEEAAQAAAGGQRDELRASAARAYQAAGNAEAARKIWDELVKNEASPLADEARVRLGEVAAKPAS